MKTTNVNELFRKENEKMQHNIPLGKLVEIDGSGGSFEYHGLRLFVVKHNRDCDGTPIYDLSFDLNAPITLENTKKDIDNCEYGSTEYRLYNVVKLHVEGSILKGFSEDCLTIIEP